MYRPLRNRGLGDLATVWADFKDFWNPALPTSTVAANYYQRFQYGTIPTPTPATVPGGAAPKLPVSYDAATGTVTDNSTGETIQVTDPAARAQALTDLINQAVASGSYTPNAAPVASDLFNLNIPSWAWALGAVVGAGLLLSVVAGGRR